MVIVDGSVFRVCQGCSKRGKPYQPSLSAGAAARKKGGAAPHARPRGDRIAMSDTTIVSPDFAKLIREARTKKGLSHEQLGMQMNEKAALLKKIESGALKPDELFARKLQ